MVQREQDEVRMPKGTDPAIVEKMSAAMEAVVSSDSFAEVLSTYYATPF